MNGNKETPLLLVTPNGVLQLIEDSFNTLSSSSIKESNISIITRIGPSLNQNCILDKGLWYKEVLYQGEDNDMTHTVILIDCIGFDYDNDPNLSLKLFILCYVMSSVIIYSDSYMSPDANTKANETKSLYQAEESFVSLLRRLKNTITNKNDLPPILLYESQSPNISISAVDSIQSPHSNSTDSYSIKELHDINNDSIVHDLFSKSIRIHTSVSLDSALNYSQLIPMLKAKQTSQGLILDISSLQTLLYSYSSLFNNKDIDIDNAHDIIDINKQMNCIRYSMLSLQCDEITAKASSYCFYDHNDERKIRDTYEFITYLISIFLQSKPMTKILPEKEHRDCMFKYFNQIVKQDKGVRLALLRNLIDLSQPNDTANDTANDNDNHNDDITTRVKLHIDSIVKDITALLTFIPLLSNKNSLYTNVCNSFMSKMNHILACFEQQNAEMKEMKEMKEIWTKEMNDLRDLKEILAISQQKMAEMKKTQEVNSKEMNNICALKQKINDSNAELTKKSEQFEEQKQQYQSKIMQLETELRDSNEAIEVLSQESNEKVLLENNQSKLIEIIKLLSARNRDMRTVEKVINSFNNEIREKIKDIE